MVPVSSKETTLLDEANDIAIAGGVDNAANIIIKLCEETEPDIGKIIDLSARYPVTALRRLGYILDEYLDISGLDALRDACSKHNEAPSILDPQAGSEGVINKTWNIKINREVSPDI
jgi:predicted transcriptional regulator of viral defense system